MILTSDGAMVPNSSMINFRLLLDGGQFSLFRFSGSLVQASTHTHGNQTTTEFLTQALFNKANREWIV